ncbi:general stress protein [Propionibacterium australiense]|uniref:General stress protein 17M-like domain-containing protein n=1 Tax=Propionibacterium australiense TaxID=119981 RepID=A0A383S7I9_9ACTN|nr:general stress protein [Propionibacterium australiense]RLP09622.1 hypothetical protein D7U36_07450 [Propionibacterium australiense]RLP12324.1 hypothetical protein D9T14_00230 [Propionibacterium australiense]SYZ33522.1 Hypothetical protein PROPAUS_1441 [Propionibacterium australiense]VEH89643.1 Uncharacterised protein [Propionibacterium australiense]
MTLTGGTASVPGRGGARLQLRSPASIAIYDSYEDAQHAVDYLADRNFPVQFLSIVGTDLKSIERITGGLNWGRVLISAAMNGLVWGAMAALLFYFFIPEVSPAVIFLGAIVVFVLANVITSAISYAMTGGRRDFTSASQIVATRYEVLGESEVAGQARQLLTGGQPVRTVPHDPAQPAGVPAAPTDPVGGQQPPAYGPPAYGQPQPYGQGAAQGDLSDLPAPGYPAATTGPSGAPGQTPPQAAGQGGGTGDGEAFDPTDRGQG